DFELVTSTDLSSTGKGMDTEFQHWYGLQERYKLVRLPVHLRKKYPFPQNYRSVLYYKLATLYSCLKENSLVYTRTSEIVELLLKLGRPVVWECHEPIDSNSLRAKFFKDPNLIGVVTLSSQLANNYIQLGLNPDRVFITHSAVDLSVFTPVQDKTMARQKLSLPFASKMILYSGHLYDSKGIPTILKLAQMMPEYTFVLVGGWVNDVNRVKEKIQKEDLSNAYVMGHRSPVELASYLYAADLLILPTSQSWNLAEVTSPLKLFEYMAVKKPIVASALPNIMTVLQDGKNALLAAPDNPLSFRDAIVKLFENPHLATTLADRAFQDVQNFTWETRADNVWQFVWERLQTTQNSMNFSQNQLTRYLRTIQMTIASDLDPFFQEVIRQDRKQR
ncbi:MAG: glycosyltransferase, partial [Geitlerinemataceae cyanobacterium]